MGRPKLRRSESLDAPRGLIKAIATFIAIMLAFLAAAFYLVGVVGGVTAWILAAMALVVALGAGYLGYGIAFVGITGRRPHGAEQLTSAAVFVSQDIHLPGHKLRALLPMIVTAAILVVLAWAFVSGAFAVVLSIIFTAGIGLGLVPITSRKAR